MSSLPTPPTEDHKSSHTRRSTKSSKTVQRTSKRSSTSSHEHVPGVLDGRHKRVWKACERCRMKKTKCDGESPCKRCKDDGLVCTAGSRKKTEFKQLPRGYAEVLENTQYALIATVQKLYTMVRNNEPWELGDPELNDRGQPVIHDIASKLGCIRPSPDLPYAFPEGAEDFAELQAQLTAAKNEMAAEDNGSRKMSDNDSSAYSPALSRADRASSTESDHSQLSKDYNQMLQSQQQQQQAQLQAARGGKPTNINTTIVKPMSYDDTYGNATFDNTSPIFTEFQTDSPVGMFRTSSPFPSWSTTGANDDYLAPSNALPITAQYMGQQYGGLPPRAQMGYMPMNDGLSFANDGTIRPGMLDCGGPMDMDQMDSVMFAPEGIEWSRA
ncbi:N-terminal fungal transcription regulatory domain-containing protein [Xylogone sp. PMI_703]|nr:N-terminal fungal transcription regulatory domain-containing protein [Xylogone sp. PMI_703]